MANGLDFYNTLLNTLDNLKELYFKTAICCLQTRCWEGEGLNGSEGREEEDVHMHHNINV